MQLKEILDENAELARRNKDLSVADDPAADIAPAVSAYRGEEKIAVGLILQGGIDHALTLAQMMVQGLDADSICLAVETFAATGLTNPVTNKPWAQHEMQGLADTQDAVAKGWVGEQILVMAANRAGDQDVTELPYLRNGNAVTWTKSEGKTGDHIGRIPKELARIMGGLSIGQVMARTGMIAAKFGLTEEEGRVMIDCMTIKSIEEEFGDLGASVAVMLNSGPGTRREELILEMFPEAVELNAGLE